MATNDGIHVFYHMTQINDWEMLVQEQIHAMCLSGLVHACEGFHVGVNGNLPITVLPKKAKVTYHDPRDWKEETSTMRMVKSFCETNPRKKVLYIMSKGVTRRNVRDNSWRLYMEYFCVHGWRQCVEDLNTYDCAGSLWVSENQIPVYPGSRPETHYPPHFSGTFWWATSDYVNRLNHSLLDTSDRLDREFWIGSGKPAVKAYKKDCAPEYGGWFYGNNILLSEDYTE